MKYEAGLFWFVLFWRTYHVFPAQGHARGGYKTESTLDSANLFMARPSVCLTVKTDFTFPRHVSEPQSMKNQIVGFLGESEDKFVSISSAHGAP